MISNSQYYLQNLARGAYLTLIFLLISFPISQVCAKDLFYLEGKTNINLATSSELIQLPFIGPKKASKIIAFRKKHGNFANFNELLNVGGIGTDLLRSIQKYIRLTGSSDLHYSQFQSAQIPSAVHIDSFNGAINVLENRKFFAVLLHKIQTARTSIHVCIYLFKTSNHPKNYANKIMHALIDAKKRGVQVSVVLELNDRSNDSLNKSNQYTANKLRKAGIRVKFDTKATITHTKLVVIDGLYLFLGSHNFSHTALAKSNETSLLIESSELSDYFTSYIETIGQFDAK